jgi:hypothetical protein
MVEKVVATPDLGNTRAELVSFVDAAVMILGSTLMGRVMQGLISDLATTGYCSAARRSRRASPSAWSTLYSPHSPPKTTPPPRRKRT